MKLVIKSRFRCWWANFNLGLIGLLFFSTTISGCDRAGETNLSSVNTKEVAGVDATSKQPIEVDVRTASLGNLASEKQYRGTTQPQKQVTWRSQTESRLVELTVEVGDFVTKNQLIGRLDDRFLLTDLAGRIGELEALNSELAQAKIQVTNAKIRLEEAEIQLEQANSEATRYQNLAATGLIPDQQAESFKTAAKIAEKALLTAREAVKLEEKAVAVAQSRIASQQSAISQAQQRQDYSQILAPISGVVIAKTKDPGSLIREGEEVVSIGDFSQIKITVPLSELDLGRVSLGQAVKVKLDAFGDRIFTGKVNRIAPTTNAGTRQIPLEISLDNPDNKIKGGLLARVSFISEQEPRVILPEKAIVEDNDVNYVFVVPQNNSNESNVTKRKVILGDRANGTVEITAGISPGEKYVASSNRPLQDRDRVALSILSQ